MDKPKENIGASQEVVPPEAPEKPTDKKPPILLIVSIVVGVIILIVIILLLIFKPWASAPAENDNPSEPSQPDDSYEIGKPTIVPATNGETYIATVYLDPVHLDHQCTAENSVTKTEIKTSCMKWYVYKQDADTYTMILAHNTTGAVSWNDDNIDVPYEQSNLVPFVNELTEKYNWQFTPRLISAFEVAGITGKTDFYEHDTYYYLDTNSQSSGDNPSPVSRYAWLFDYTQKCKMGMSPDPSDPEYGCNTEEGGMYEYYDPAYGGIAHGHTDGYWTSTPYGWINERDGRRGVWTVRGSSAALRYDDAYVHFYGIRPVITVPKTIFN